MRVTLITLGLLWLLVACGGADETNGNAAATASRAVELTQVAAAMAQPPTATATVPPTAEATPTITPTPRPRLHTVEYVMDVPDALRLVRVDVEYVDSSGEVESGYIDFNELDAEFGGKVIEVTLRDGDRAVVSLSAQFYELKCQIIVDGEVVTRKSGEGYVECVAIVGED